MVRQGTENVYEGESLLMRPNLFFPLPLSVTEPSAAEPGEATSASARTPSPSVDATSQETPSDSQDVEMADADGTVLALARTHRVPPVACVRATTLLHVWSVRPAVRTFSLRGRSRSVKERSAS